MKYRWVSVVGGGEVSPSGWETAYQVGYQLAKSGFGVVCGGLWGVMEAACKGAKKAGGMTLGILPTRNREDANPYVDIAIPTGLGEGRNVLVALTGEAMVALEGGTGTLSEVCFALKAGRPVALLNQWGTSLFERIGYSPYKAKDVEDAVFWLKSQLF